MAYLRLKNSRSFSKCQVFFSTVPEKPKRWIELDQKLLDIFLQNFRRRRRILNSLIEPKNVKQGTLRDLEHPLCCLLRNIKKLKGGHLNKFEKTIQFSDEK